MLNYEAIEKNNIANDFNNSNKNIENTVLTNKLNFESLDNFDYLDKLQILNCTSNPILIEDNNEFSIVFNNLLDLISSLEFSIKPKKELPEVDLTLTANTEEFLTLPLGEENIIFIDSLAKFNLMRERFKHSNYLGIDSEWKPITNKLNKQQTTSIIQISDKSTCFIIDYFKLKNEENFAKKFIEIFSEKIFLAFSFQSDIKNFRNAELSEFFNCKNKVIDFRDVFDGKSIGKKLNGLSDLCLKLIGKRISKRNQLSNWESRPLKKAQIYYAAMDAFVLTEIFDVMVKNKKFINMINAKKKIKI
jgi:hypothetical protein